MKANRKIIITAISTLAIGLLLGSLIFGGSSEKLTSEEHQHTNEEASEETVWTCSMHPHIRQNEPGKCPICGMDLIPLESAEGELDPMAISMSPTAMQLANVSTALVGTMEPVKSVRVNGKVQADERLVYSQSSHIPGRIEKLMVNFTGEFVNKGQPIASIYSPDLVTAQEELFEAYKTRETQPQLYNAAKEKLKNWKLTNSQIERFIQSGNPTEEFPVMADVSGYVTQKMVNLGDYIQRGTAIYEIADLSKVWVLFDVYESDMAWIRKGDKVSFTIASLSGETFSGTITYLDPIIDPKTRVAKARVEISNAGLKLKPEMFASGTVEAKLPGKPNTLVVPKTAVMWTGRRSVVYVKSTSEIGVSFIMRDVILGPALGESFIVESGLQVGEEIAVNGTFSIDAAAQLAGKPSMMNPEGGAIMTGHDHGGGNNPTTSKSSPHAKTIIVSKKAKGELKSLLNSYLNLKGALAIDDFKKALSEAKQTSLVLSKINMGLFTGEAHNVWMKHSSILEKELRNASDSKDIETLRKSFKRASEQLIMIYKTFGSLGETLFIDYCAMADGNKGADWLSKEKEIKNPYLGQKMIRCGEVKQEIK
ncbi:MAG TPA: efflux RND transporter periplasmic adaptor subunit [Bacteroidetes bacterium]|nr:efflux RND transporter periplasmic adaptor subunit [Bacteroidota bacterium]